MGMLVKVGVLVYLHARGKCRVLPVFIEKETFVVIMLGPRQFCLFETSSPALENSLLLTGENFLLPNCSIRHTNSIKQSLLLHECKWFKSSTLFGASLPYNAAAVSVTQCFFQTIQVSLSVPDRCTDALVLFDPSLLLTIVYWKKDSSSKW